MHSEGYGTWVCLSVCWFATLHLTSEMPVHLKNNTAYLTGKGCQTFLKMLHFRDMVSFVYHGSAYVLA